MTEDSDAIYRRLAGFMREFDSLTEAIPRSIIGERIYRSIAALDLHAFNKEIVLSSIRTFESGKGNGSLTLDWLCALADKHGVAITGTVKSYDTKIVNDGIPQDEKTSLTASQLKAWYVRRGFTVGALEMRREPKNRSGS